MDSTQNTGDTSASNFFLPGISYDDFVDKSIIELLGLQNLSPDEHDQILKTMMDTIQSRVISRILNAFTDEEYGKVKSAIENNDQDTFFTLLAEKNLNLEQIYTEEALFYKTEIIDLAKSGASDNSKNSSKEE